MNAEAFVKNIEGYYGKYEMPLRRAMVLEYMAQYEPAEVDKIFDRVIRTYSGQFRFAPDIAVIEKAIAEYNEEMKVHVGGEKLAIGYKAPAPALPAPSITDDERGSVGKLLNDLVVRFRAGKVVVKR
jgi:hypothetical protein